VKPIGELDHKDAPVLGHGDEHLAHGRGLLGFLGGKVQPVELGHPIDNRRDLGAEGGLDLQEIDVGVLDDIVQQSSGCTRRVEPEVCDDEGHREGMGDIGLTRQPELAGVGLFRERVGLANDRAVLARPVHF
jgi:hypothetical protein